MHQSLFNVLISDLERHKPKTVETCLKLWLISGCFAIVHKWSIARRPERPLLLWFVLSRKSGRVSGMSLEVYRPLCSCDISLSGQEDQEHLKWTREVSFQGVLISQMLWLNSMWLRNTTVDHQQSPLSVSCKWTRANQGIISEDHKAGHDAT